jgi:hypothetical protein
MRQHEMDEESFRAFLFEHLRRRPRMEVRDVYKLLYQGVFGVAHLMGEEAWERLREEAERVAQMDHLDEPLVEAVSVDGGLVRVNLRPYIRQGGDLRALYRAMLESSEHEGDPTEFASLWGLFKEAAAELKLDTDDETIRLYDRSLEEKGPEPRHHSAAYREAYYPAYRVVMRRMFEEYTGFSS